MQGSVSCVVGEVEASHVGGLMVLLRGRWYSEVKVVAGDGCLPQAVALGVDDGKLDIVDGGSC